MNLNGYTHSASDLKDRIMLYGSPDIICLGETHLDVRDNIVLQGFKYFGNPRTAHYTRKSGGVAVLVAEETFQQYSVDVCCCDMDGILGLKLEHIETGYITGIICNYLPPVNSVFGMDPEGFFGRLLQLSYECNNYDMLLYVGDFNARIGQKLDSDSTLIPDRVAVDKTVNSHGKSLLEFLNDSDSCVLNGRFGDASFTCNASVGSSVVDYAIVHVDTFDRIKSFALMSMEEIVHDLKIEGLIGPGSAVPDHSLIVVELVSSGYLLQDLVKGLGTKNHNLENRKKVPRKFKSDYMNNQRIKQALTACIERLQASDKSQSIVDECYDELTAEILWEMDKFKKLSKRNDTPYKHYWNSNLSALWKDMREKFYMVKSVIKGVHKRQLKRLKVDNQNVRAYFISQSRFDKELRAAKRAHSEVCIENLEKLTSGNPKDFWSEVNKLGPRRRNNLVCEAFDIHGNVTRDTDTVLKHWGENFANLYGTAPVGDFDEDFLCIKRDNLESLPEDDLANSSDFNVDISLMEVKRAVDNAKKGKATGIDNIPTEALQNVTCIEMLHNLFRECFRTGLLPSEWSKCNIVPIGKGMTSISTDPLSHRGLAMQCCIFKLYCLILNNRLYSYAELNDCLHESQNGFRRGRGCIDHIFSLTEAIKMNLPMPSSRVFACFVDIKKAFPSVNRELLLWRLHEIGVHGRMYAAIKASFRNPLCRLKLPIGETTYFDNLYGTLEGSPNSPLNFSLFLDGLLREMDASGLGIYYGSQECDRFAVLAYADDLVLVASNSEDLQKEIDILKTFCSRW